MRPRRLLIVKTSSMGDVIHGLALASDLARRFPDCAIDWVVEEAFAELPRLHPAIREVHRVALRRWRRDPWSAASWRALLAAWRALRAQPYDAILDCQGLLKSALIAATARGPVAGFDRASAREPAASLLYRHRLAVPRTAHAVDRNRALGAALFGYGLDTPARFGLREAARRLAPLSAAGAWAASAASASGGVRPYALLLTNASRPGKRWPDERWRELEAWLAAQGLLSVLPWGSRAERTESEERARAMRAAVVPERMSLTELAVLAARAHVVVGLDTGLTHLAAAVGAPSVGICCDFDPALVGLRAEGGAPTALSLGGVGQRPAVVEVIGALASVLATASTGDDRG